MVALGEPREFSGSRTPQTVKGRNHPTSSAADDATSGQSHRNFLDPLTPLIGLTLLGPSGELSSSGLKFFPLVPLRGRLRSCLRQVGERHLHSAGCL
jgi:hypothetical protein